MSSISAPDSVGRPFFAARSRSVRSFIACNIGPNPTFGEQARKVEAHLIDFHGDLYGRTVELDFLERLRPTRAFAGLDDLLGQIRRDVDEARRIAANP